MADTMTITLARDRGPGTWEPYDGLTITDAGGTHQGFATEIVDGRLVRAWFPKALILLEFKPPNGAA